MFLTREQLKDLTGYQRKNWQIRHLRKLKIPFLPDKDGNPKVTVDAIQSVKKREPKLRLG